MKIHYIRNAWGRLIPIYFDPCCAVMTMQFSPDDQSIYKLAKDEPKLIQFTPSGKKIANDNITNCPNCKSQIEFIQRELKDE